MRALEYEYVIRRAHQCGRHGVVGANADTYRQLERKSKLYLSAKHEIENDLPRSWKGSITDLAFDYGSIAGEVANNITVAIYKIQSDLEHRLTQGKQEELEKCKLDCNYSA